MDEHARNLQAKAVSPHPGTKHAALRARSPEGEAAGAKAYDKTRLINRAGLTASHLLVQGRRAGRSHFNTLMTCLNAGVSARRSHSKAAISTVTMTTPAADSRVMAVA